jgi:hypothetical protein
MAKFGACFEILEAGPEKGTIGSEVPKDPKAVRDVDC